MDIQRKEPRRYCGRVEFLACLENIIELQKKGHSKLSIYELLHAENKIVNISYRTFCLYLFEYNKKHNTKKGDVLPKPCQPVLPRIVSKDEKFNYAPNPDTEINEVELFGADVLNKKE